MKDRLEEFIRQNRSEFDDHDLPSGAWKKIERELVPRRRSHSWLMPVLKVAAVVALLALSFLAVRRLADRERPGGPAGNLSGQTLDQSIDAGLARQQKQYISLIGIKRDELRQLQRTEPELYTEFASEIEKLERSYASLRSELEAAPDRELVLEAMIQNLRYQTELLNRQLAIIQRVNAAKKDRKL